MDKSLDFVFRAQRDVHFRNKIESALGATDSCEICTDILRINFNPDKNTVTITPLSETSLFHAKVIHREITYNALQLMLDDKWEEINPDEIRLL